MVHMRLQIGLEQRQDRAQIPFLVAADAASASTRGKG